MKKLLLVAAIAVFGVSAYAQVSKPVGLAVRGGVILPAAGYGRELGRTWFGIGADYRLSNLNFNQGGAMAGNSSLAVSFDYYGKGEASAVPIALNYMVSQNEFFYTVGAGLTLTRDKDGGNSTNQTTFGYQLGVGYNFQQGQTPLFVQAKYFGSGNSRLNAFGLYVGIRL